MNKLNKLPQLIKIMCIVSFFALIYYLLDKYIGNQFYFEYKDKDKKVKRKEECVVGGD